jgi:hypothetical protein
MRRLGPDNPTDCRPEYQCRHRQDVEQGCLSLVTAAVPVISEQAIAIGKIASFPITDI